MSSSSELSISIVHPNAKVLQSILKTVATFNEKPPLKIGNAGLTCRVMDSSHVGMLMLELTVPNTAFTAWPVSVEKTLCLDLNLFMKRFPKPIMPYPVNLIIKGDKLKTQFRGRVVKQVTVATLEDWIPTEEIPVPKRIVDEQMKATVTLPAQDFCDAVDDFSRNNDIATFKATQPPNPKGNASFELLYKSDLEEETYEFTFLDSAQAAGEVKASYNSSYLWQCTKTIKQMHQASKTVKPTVKLEWTDNWPLRITTQLRDQTLTRFYLAPRIERIRMYEPIGDFDPTDGDDQPPDTGEE